MVRVGSQARKVGEIKGNNSAAAISDNLFNLKDELEERHSVFGKMRLIFCDVVLVPDDTDKKHLLQAPRSTMVTILSTNLHTLIEKVFHHDVGQHALRAIVVASNANSSDEFAHLNFGILAKLRAGEEGLSNGFDAEGMRMGDEWQSGWRRVVGIRVS